MQQHFTKTRVIKDKSAGIVCCHVLLIVSFTSLYLRYLASFIPEDNLLETSEVTSEGNIRQSINLDDTLDYRARHGVETRTSWKAPIIWEGMFDPVLYDQTHIQYQSSVALTVFAVGRYLDAYLKTFLISAEQHFMLGLKIHAYFYKLPKERWTYDKNPNSKAYMEYGDYYYHAAVFGGLWEHVKTLADHCFLGIMEDKLNDVEALWHD
ncbi:hypothetical protein FQN60_011439, partial [Etheostoma spectabile]